jgi:hypothetical protein
MAVQPRSEAAAHYGRLVFALYVFGPILSFFLLPPLFFRVPMTVFLNDNRMATVDARYVATALIVCIVWFAISAGIVLVPFTNREAPAWDWSPAALRTAFVLVSVAGSAVALAHAFRAFPGGIEDVVQQVSFGPAVGFVLGIQLLRRGGAGVRRAAVLALLAIDLVVALAVPVALSKVTPAALNTVAVLYGLTVSGISWRRQLLVGLLLVPIVLAALPLKEYLRMQFFHLDPFHRAGEVLKTTRASLTPPIVMTFNERLAEFNPWVHGLRFHRASGPFLLAQFGLTRILQRTNRLSDLAYTVEATPAQVPYAMGVTYKPLLSKVIPRLVWPHKPEEDAGQFYGHRYPFLDPPDTVHSMNLPMVTEGWINGGWIGIILSALFVGVFLSAVWTFCIGAAGAPGNVVLGMAVVGAAADGESNLSLVLGGALHALLVYGAFVAAVCWLSRMAPRTAPA